MLAFLGPVSALPGARQATKAHDLPHLVMAVVDDLGYGDLGFTGHPTSLTPELDRRYLFIRYRYKTIHYQNTDYPDNRYYRQVTLSIVSLRI